MSLNEKLFIIVPLISVLCNAFLFLTCLSAKKDRVVYAFMELLAVFMAWCGGSLFMRLELYPGPLFWYEVSIMGISSCRCSCITSSTVFAIPKAISYACCCSAAGSSLLQ